ncbi:MAG TPA: sodium/proline symporter PutP [Gammaproteobacteria bacterium]|nr:sodium/proline symporter PutP [Gammaproteobacteria bacterium]
MLADNTVIILTFLVYLAIVLLLGFIAWRRTKSLKDYILGGRSLGSWVTALSAQASDMSGWLLMGLPGFAYLAGLSSGWMAIGLLSGTYLNWKLVAERLRRRTETLDDSLTLPDYFERQFTDKSRLLRLISGIFILIFFVLYTSSGFVAGGKLFEALFGLDYRWAVFAAMASVLVYTFMGGFLAVSWADVLQGSLMFFALVIVAAMGWWLLGGPGGLTHTLNALNPTLLNPFVNADTGEILGWIGIISLLGWGLGYFGQPHILARFMAIKDPAEIPVARRIAMSWQTIVLVAALFIGLVGLGLLERRLVGPESEKVFIFLAVDLLYPVIAGICLSGILAAVMSTAAAQLLVASSAFSEDFYRGLFRPDADGRELLWVGRLAVAAIAVIAFVIALDPNSKVLTLVSWAWAGFGATFGPAMLLSLYWQGMTRNGALAGVIVGGLTVIIWPQFEGGIFALYELVPGFIFSALAIVLVSQFGNKPSVSER